MCRSSAQIYSRTAAKLNQLCFKSFAFLGFVLRHLHSKTVAATHERTAGNAKAELPHPTGEWAATSNCPAIHVVL
jgi:hypothetical protein